MAHQSLEKQPQREATQNACEKSWGQFEPVALLTVPTCGWQ